MENKNHQNRFYLVYLTGFFLILALPLLAIPPYFSPPIWGQVIFFRIILSILIFGLIIQFLYKKDKFSVVQRIVQRISAVKTGFYLLIALLGIYFLATIFSQDVYFSFWGSPARSGGFLNFSFFILFSIFVLLTLKERDWQKIWDFSILIGVLVALFGVCQYFGLFPDFLIAFEGGGVPSTTGYNGFFATYLSLLLFLAISFGLTEKSKKKFFYFSCVLLFLFGVIISGARASYLGVLIGLLYFLFSYPKKVKLLKPAVGIILVLAVATILYVNFSPKIPEFLQNNKVFSYLVSRASIKALWVDLTETRLSVWKIGIKAIKEKPILGWGPENFQIAFDKNYDPSLPRMADFWWDRAHNFLVEYAVNGGVLFLIVYLGLIGVLFFQLQKLKNADNYADNNADNTLIYHGIQAGFICYLTYLLFSFDGFVTYLIFFLLIAYSLYLISSGSAEKTRNNTLKNAESFSANQRDNQRNFSGESLLFKLRTFITAILFILLIGFIWYFNIKPLKINKEIVLAEYLIKNGKCEAGLLKIEKIFSQKSILDSYIRLKYLDMIKKCSTDNSGKNLEYATKGIAALKESIEIQPNFTRSWLLLGGLTNILISKESDLQKREQLIKDAYSYFENAEKLSPRRPELFIEWLKTDLLSENYQGMQERAEKCLSFSKDTAGCNWFLGLSELALGNVEQGQKQIAIAQQKGYPVDSPAALNQLLLAYINTKNYKGLVEVYQKFILLNPSDSQSYASLAFVYRELGNYEKARQEALKALELSPESKASVDAFLRTLPLR